MPKHQVPLNTLKDCFRFLLGLKNGKRVEEVARQLHGRIKKYYKNSQQLERKLKSALSNFLTTVHRFYVKLVCENIAKQTYDVRKNDAAKLLDALLECIPKFLAAMYFLWYNVDERFHQVGGGKWKLNHPGVDGYRWVWSWARSGDWGGATQRYLRATTQSPEFGRNSGVIPGGFLTGDLKEGWKYNYNEGYYYAEYMIRDIEAILYKNEHNYFRDVFVTSVISTETGIETSNTANVVGLLGVFCEIVQSDTGVVKKALEAEARAGNRCIYWTELKRQCGWLKRDPINDLFKPTAFNHTGKSPNISTLNKAEFAKQVANWLTENLLKVREKVSELNHIQYNSQMVPLNHFATKYVFPYGFHFGENSYGSLGDAWSFLKSVWQKNIRELSRRDTGGHIIKLKRYLDGNICKPGEADDEESEDVSPPVTTPEAPKETAPETPTENSEATKTEVANPPVQNVNGDQVQGKKAEGAQNQGKKAEGAQNQGKKTEGAQNQGSQNNVLPNQNNGQSEEKSTGSSVAKPAPAPSPSPKGSAGPLGSTSPGAPESSHVTGSRGQNTAHVQHNNAQHSQVPSPPSSPPGPPAYPAPASPSGDKGKSSPEGFPQGPPSVASSSPVKPQVPSVKLPAPPSSVAPAPGDGRGPGVQVSTPGTTQHGVQGTSQSSTNAVTTKFSGSSSGAGVGVGGAGGGGNNSGVTNEENGKAKTSCKNGIFYDFGSGKAEYCPRNGVHNNPNPSDQDKLEKIWESQKRQIVENIYDKHNKNKQNRQILRNRSQQPPSQMPPTPPTQPSRPAAGLAPLPTGGNVSHGHPFYEPGEGRHRQEYGGIVVNKPTEFNGEPIPDTSSKELREKITKKVEGIIFLKSLERAAQREEVENIITSGFNGDEVHAVGNSMEDVLDGEVVTAFDGKEAQDYFDFNRVQKESTMYENADTTLYDLYKRRQELLQKQLDANRVQQDRDDMLRKSIEHQIQDAKAKKVQEVASFNAMHRNAIFDGHEPLDIEEQLVEPTRHSPVDAYQDDGDMFSEKFQIPDLYMEGHSIDHTSPITLNLFKSHERQNPDLTDQDVYGANVSETFDIEVRKHIPPDPPINYNPKYITQIKNPAYIKSDGLDDFSMRATDRADVNIPMAVFPNQSPDDINPYVCRNSWYVFPSSTDITHAPPSPHPASDHLPPPKTVREMLHWLVGFNTYGLIGQIKDCVDSILVESNNAASKSPYAIEVTGYPNELDASHVSDKLTEACLYAASVLYKIRYKDSLDAYETFFKDQDKYAYYYSTDPACLLCQLRDYVYACCHQLEFLKAQCKRDKLSGGWKNCYYGSNITFPNSPLLAFLTDGWDSTFKTHPFDPRNLCLKSRVRMGFRKEDFPKTSQLGSVISTILTPSCGGEDPLLTLSSYLNCLTRRTPRTTGELVSYFHNFGNEMHGYASESLSSLGSSLSTPHVDCPDWDRLDGAGLGAVRGIRGSESLNVISKNNSSHDKEHPRTLSTLVGCGSDSSNCHPHCSPITYRAYALYSQNFAHTYLSWVVYLPDRLWESLYKLFYELKKHDYAKCTSLYLCSTALPLLYTHGFTPPEGTSQSPPTCSDVISKLQEIVNGKPIADLMTAMDNFLYRVREPFIYTLVTLWSTAFFFIANTMLYRLDVLRIRSHFTRTRGSHVIDVKALLTDGTTMPSLYDIDYFDEDTVVQLGV